MKYRSYPGLGPLWSPDPLVRGAEPLHPLNWTQNSRKSNSKVVVPINHSSNPQLLPAEDRGRNTPHPQTVWKQRGGELPHPSTASAGLAHRALWSLWPCLSHHSGVKVMLLQSVSVLYLPVSVSASGHGVVRPLLPSIHKDGASQVWPTAFLLAQKQTRSNFLSADRPPEGTTEKDGPQDLCLENVPRFRSLQWKKCYISTGLAQAKKCFYWSASVPDYRVVAQPMWVQWQTCLCMPAGCRRAN